MSDPEGGGVAINTAVINPAHYEKDKEETAKALQEIEQKMAELAAMREALAKATAPEPEPTPVEMPGVGERHEISEEELAMMHTFDDAELTAIGIRVEGRFIDLTKGSPRLSKVKFGYAANGTLVFKDASSLMTVMDMARLENDTNVIEFLAIVSGYNQHITKKPSSSFVRGVARPLDSWELVDALGMSSEISMPAKPAPVASPVTDYAAALEVDDDDDDEDEYDDDGNLIIKKKKAPAEAKVPEWKKGLKW